jgi:hypothetical protein
MLSGIVPSPPLFPLSGIEKRREWRREEKI